MAAVASRQSTAANSPHRLSSPATRAQSESIKKDPSAASDSRPGSTIPSIKKPDEEAATKGAKDAPPANAPLAPPPKPNAAGDGDYFAGAHTHAHFSKEPNPFENAFGNPADTPGKTQLPGVGSLTSPAPFPSGTTPAGWAGSLRTGPLSPAMLTGPTNPDYFNSDHHFSGSFPTPNESSLRTGLTPGGGGSMFPHPSPNSQALYNSLQSGGATPGTLDFHRTAMTARAAQSHGNPYNGHVQNPATSQPPTSQNIQPDLDSKPYLPANGSTQQDSQDPFGSHQTNDAANGLFMLAQAGGQRGPQQAYPMQQQQQQHQQPPPPQTQGYEKHANKASVGSMMSGSTEAGEQYSDDNETKPSARNGRGKKAPAGKTTQNGKRKTEEVVGKGQANKKQRGSNGMPVSPEMMDDDDEDMDVDDPTSDKKMTDEEKRKNFLERNRVAALKCRQRKKQWLANLQQKVEIFSTENDALAATVTQLREEIVGLKTLLLAHKECPVSQAQGIAGHAMHQITGDASNFANPYGMAMGPGIGQQQQAQMAQGQMQRR